MTESAGRKGTHHCVLICTNCNWLSLKVRENRARRDAERQSQQREREAQRVAREETKRRKREEEVKKKQEAHRQEELMQQEMVQLRRQMQERKGPDRVIRQRYGLHSNRQPSAEVVTTTRYSKLPQVSWLIALDLILVAPTAYNG